MQGRRAILCKRKYKPMIFQHLDCRVASTHVYSFIFQFYIGHDDPPPPLHYINVIYSADSMADPEIFKKGGQLQKGGPTPQNSQKFVYFGSQILSFTNI
jgi:hypothetical protein